MARDWNKACQVAFGRLEGALESRVCSRPSQLDRAVEGHWPCLPRGTQKAEPPCEHPAWASSGEQRMGLHKPKPQLVLNPSLNLSWWGKFS